MLDNSVRGFTPQHFFTVIRSCRTMHMEKSARGFIALMSAIIIAAILLIVVIGGGMLGLFTRFDILDSENKEHSAALVDSCADTIMSALAADPTYAGPQTVTVGSDHCQVLSSTTSGTHRTFQVQAIYNNAYTDALVTLYTGTAAMLSWQEVGHF